MPIKANGTILLNIKVNHCYQSLCFKWITGKLNNLLVPSTRGGEGPAELGWWHMLLSTHPFCRWRGRGDWRIWRPGLASICMNHLNLMKIFPVFSTSTHFPYMFCVIGLHSDIGNSFFKCSSHFLLEPGLLSLPLVVCDCWLRRVV